jgi:CoA transferase family III
MNAPTRFEDKARAAVADLYAGLGQPVTADQLDRLAFSGEEPDFDTRHQTVLASASVTAAYGLGVAEYWRLGHSTRQRVDIDLVQAAAALHPAQFQCQNDHPIPALSLARELKADFYRTADQRWFFPIGSYPHHRDGVLALLDCPNRPERLAEAISSWRGEELEDAFAGARLPGAMARDRAEWAEHPQGRLLAAMPAVEIEKIGDSPPEFTAGRHRPFDRLRVIDMAHVIAGPVAARTLAEHGADVLRISSPYQPDPIPQILDTGIGKRAAYLDLTREDQRARLAELCADADVFVQSWRPGAMERLGFAATDLARLRPGVVYVSVSAYGAAGPWASRGGFEQLGQVVSGLAVEQGDGERPSMVPTYLLNDYLTAYLGAVGAVAGLLARAERGGSYHVRVSLTRTSMWVLSLGRRTPSRPVRPADLRPVLETRESPFGTLRQLPPVARLSQTPPRWDRPPVPLGAHRPVWLDRDIEAASAR